MYRKILIMLAAAGLGVSVAACSSTGPGRVLTDFRGLDRAGLGYERVRTAARAYVQDPGPRPAYAHTPRAIIRRYPR